MIKNNLEGATQVFPESKRLLKPHKIMSLFLKPVEDTPKPTRMFASVPIASDFDKPVKTQRFSSLFAILRNFALVASILTLTGAILVFIGVTLAFSFAMGLIVFGAILLMVGVLLGIDFVRST